jgi:hypothetical protein
VLRGLYEYYRTQPLLPTFADLRDEAAFADYADKRAALLRDRVALPPASFAGKDVLEFGPDSGENALVFASWGARLTLVEPNERAHETIRAYFARFGMEAALAGISGAHVLEYRDDARYDLIDAEGFIYTVQPARSWLAAFRALLRDDGLFIVTYYERFGALVELTLRALHALHRRTTGLDAVAAARKLYTAKWDVIPHTRTFESWVMDVLENPFVSGTTFIDARAFVDDLLATGFDLYASYPQYADPLRVDWHKRITAPAERAAQAKAHLARSVLSFAAGRKLYIVDDAVAAQVAQTADRIVDDLDVLIAHDDAGAAERVAAGFARLGAVALEASLIADTISDRTETAALFASLAHALVLAASGEAEALAKHATTDAAFIAGWGQPVHVAAGRALPAAR